MQPFIAEEREEIAELCRRHHVKRLAIFGSAVRDDFDPTHSDVDLLVAFEPEFPDQYTKNFLSLQNKMMELFDRDVDLVREGVIRNRYRLQSINDDKVTLYAA
jgi:predicted nucleotidyltransferase